MDCTLRGTGVNCTFEISPHIHTTQWTSLGSFPIRIKPGSKMLRASRMQETTEQGLHSGIRFTIAGKWNSYPNLITHSKRWQESNTEKLILHFFLLCAAFKEEKHNENNILHYIQECNCIRSIEVRKEQIQWTTMVADFVLLRLHFTSKNAFKGHTTVFFFNLIYFLKCYMFLCHIPRNTRWSGYYVFNCQRLKWSHFALLKCDLQ